MDSVREKENENYNLREQINQLQIDLEQEQKNFLSVKKNARDLMNKQIRDDNNREELTVFSLSNPKPKYSKTRLEENNSTITNNTAFDYSEDMNSNSNYQPYNSLSPLVHKHNLNDHKESVETYISTVNMKKVSKSLSIPQDTNLNHLIYNPDSLKETLDSQQLATVNLIDKEEIDQFEITNLPYPRKKESNHLNDVPDENVMNPNMTFGYGLKTRLSEQKVNLYNIFL